MEKIGKYHILEKVGQGGMGVVYKALDPLIERVVALKMISSNLNADPELRARFFREGRSAGQLSHKNIVTIFDLGEENGTAYLAMEFLEGEDLRAMVSRGEPQTLQEKVRIMIEICEGLAHAHEKSVVHRDIKPANVIITTAGQTKILDFGLARMETSDLTTSGHALGTPNYMSPEQVRGEKVDYRTDIFSVGVLFYELLTRRKAFQGDSYTSTIYKILEDEPEPIEHFDPTIPPELSAIVFKALAKDQDLRYQSLREMLADLTAFSGLARPASVSVAAQDPRGQEGATIISPPLATPPGGGLAAKPLGPRTPVPSGGRPVAKSDSVPPPGDRPERPQTQLTVVPQVEQYLPEESTSVEAVPHPRPSGRSRLLLGVACVFVIALAGLIWTLVRHQAGKVGLPDSRPAAAAVVERPASPPASSATQTQPAPRHEPDPAMNDQVSARLAKASSDLEARRFSEAAQAARKILDTTPENQEAQSILRKAGQALDSIRTGLLRAKSFISAGDESHARAALEDVLAISPSEAEASQLMSRLNQNTRTRADRALAELKDAKSGALNVRSQDLAPQSLEAAKAVETQANGLYAAGRYEQATPKFGEATDLYRLAEKEARAEALRAERLRSSESQRQQDLLRAKSENSRQAYERERDLANQGGTADKARDLFDEAEKIANGAGAKFTSGNFEGAAHDYDAATTAMSHARSVALQAAQKEAPHPTVLPKPAPPASPVGQSPPEAHESPEEVQKEIVSLPERYKNAMEGKDLSLLKSIWPALGSQQEQAFRSQWSYTRSLRIALRDLKIQALEKDSAVVTVLLHNEQQIDSGMNKKWDQRATFGLIRKKGGWVIESATFEVVH